MPLIICYRQTPHNVRVNFLILVYCQRMSSTLNYNSLWNAELAQILRTAELDDVWRYIFHVFRDNLDISSISVIQYFGDTMPEVLFSEAADDPSGVRITAYLQGAYLLDPFFQASLDQMLEGCYSLSNLSPDNFKKGEYYNTFFAAYGLMDEINLFFQTDGGKSVAISLGRETGSRRFGHRTRRVLEASCNFLGPVVERSARRAAHRPDHINSELRADFHAKLKAALERLGTRVLTPREKTIIDHLLRGYSVKVAAERLGVSEGTVRIHRHSIYAKLDIGSQTELFALVIEALKHMDPAGNADPLECLLPPSGD